MSSLILKAGTEDKLIILNLFFAQVNQVSDFLFYFYQMLFKFKGMVCAKKVPVI